jgi:hypothetical protein
MTAEDETMRILIGTHANLYPLSQLPSAVVDREDLEVQGE